MSGEAISPPLFTSHNGEWVSWTHDLHDGALIPPPLDPALNLRYSHLPRYGRLKQFLPLLEAQVFPTDQP